jgi:hypothetical protein
MSARQTVEAIERKIKAASPMSKELREAMFELPLPHQLAFLRRYYKIPQSEIAAALDVTQGFFARLEKTTKPHLMPHYVKAADLLGARVLLMPRRSN